MNIGAEIKKVAIDRGLTLTELADRSGIKRPYFSIRVNGHRCFDVNELSSIGTVLGIPAWELMRRAEEAASARGHNNPVDGKDVA